MSVKLVQQKIPIDSHVRFTLKNGKEIQGILVEIGREHITVETKDNLTTILAEMLGAWEILESEDVLTGINRPDITLEVNAKLIEIESRFINKLHTSRIELKHLDFNIPPDEDNWEKTDLIVWNKIKNRFENASRIHELSDKFGRVQPIVNDLKMLAERVPASTAIKRHLAYLYSISGKREEAIQCCQNITISERKAFDWFNLAVNALSYGKEELASYSLEQFFHKVSVIQEQDAWYVYVHLLRKFNNYSSLNKLYHTTERKLAEEDLLLLLDTGIYLLKTLKGEKEARIAVEKWITGSSPGSLVLDILKEIDGQSAESYQKFMSEFIKEEQERRRKTEPTEPTHPQGYIYLYNQNRGYGFLNDLSSNRYFFHRSAIIDETLLNDINNFEAGKQTPVVFSVAHSAKGPIAVQISLYRTIGELFKLATDYADDGEYLKGIAQIKRVIALNPDYPNAKKLYDKWRDYAQEGYVPKGSNPYARAKRAQLIEKDLERAVKLLHEAIKLNDNVDSAIKDLASILVQVGRTEEAIEVIGQNRKKVKNQQSLENLLVSIYLNGGMYEQAIALLQKNLEYTTDKEKKAQILMQIANSYLKREDYINAEKKFNELLRVRPGSILALRNVALCLSKQGRYEEAVNILNQIQNTSPNTKVAELLDAIIQAKDSGKSARVDEIIIETTLSDFTSDMSRFTQFFLNNCDFQGIEPNRIKEDERKQKTYIGSNRDARFDIERLENFANELGPRRPSERAGYYLSAAKMVSIFDIESKQFYKYLCRSFASRGDAAVNENRHLDTARAWYCETLRIYDFVRGQSRDEQGHRKEDSDAVNALVRFLFSTLGRTEIPVPPESPSLDDTIEKVINRHPQRDKVFDAVVYVTFHSQFAANSILKRLFSKPTLQAMTIEYLRQKGIVVSNSVGSLSEFVSLWNEVRRKNFDDFRAVSNELQLLNNFEFTTAWLESSIERVKNIGDRLFFDLDQQRIRQIQMIFETALELCKQVSFEEKERLCIQINNRCQDLHGEIEDNPTKLSLEQLYYTVEVIQVKVNEHMEELYETSKPQIILRLPVESQIPDNELRIEVQIAVENKIGRSPAESLELVVQSDDEFFAVTQPEIKLCESLLGGAQRILTVPLRVTDRALQSQTFSITPYVQYRTRSGEIIQTNVENFSIRLYSEEDFEEIDNPYVTYAEGGPVDNPAMFFGREELLQNISRSILGSHVQSKCIIVFGQKRAGKSSILYHLKKLLEKEEDLLVLDLGSIGAILDEHSSIPLLYQILWSIIGRLRDAIEDRMDNGFSPLNISFPRDMEFYSHPTPLTFFKDIFDKYKRITVKLEDWKSVRIVVLIDEFSYIYGQIVTGKMPDIFMKNWKALLQENYFNAVLAGQDVMPKFKQRFPNEFGTTQDERVSYLKIEDAIRLIDEPVRIGGQQGESRYRERAINRIVDLTEGSPFYIQIICNRIVEYMNRKRAMLVTEADVEQVKNDLIRGINALSIDKFDNLINSGDTSNDAITDEDAIKVLKGIAVNSQTGPCNCNSITCKTRSPIDVILDDLVKREVIERERDQYYKIRIGLFKEWLIANQ